MWGELLYYAKCSQCSLACKSHISSLVFAGTGVRCCGTVISQWWFCLALWWPLSFTASIRRPLTGLTSYGSSRPLVRWIKWHYLPMMSALITQTSVHKPFKSYPFTLVMQPKIMYMEGYISYRLLWLITNVPTTAICIST